MVDISSYFRPLPEDIVSKRYTLDPYKIGDFTNFHIHITAGVSLGALAHIYLVAFNFKVNALYLLILF